MSSLFATGLHALTHGWSGVAFSYATVQGPLLTALVRGRAQWRKLLWSPVYAVPVLLGAGIGSIALEPMLRGLGIPGGGLMQFFTEAGVCAAAGYVSGRVIAKDAASNVAHRRGADVADSESTARPRRTRSARGDECDGARTERGRDAQLNLAGIPVPRGDEAKHFKFVGTTGTGKSTAICEVLAGALKRGDRAIIADPDGGYVQRFYDERRGDVILNPFEPKAAKWDLYGEIKTDYDVEQLARSLIPDHDGPERSWREYARTFFTAVVQQTRDGNIKDVSELYRMLVMADTDELKTLVAGTPAQPFLNDGNKRMFDSVRSVTSSAVGALQYIGQQEGAPLSVREWVGRDTGSLFIPYRAGQIAALRAPISAWMRLAIFETMNQEPGDKRLWFVVDELDALGQIDGLKDALARLRKFGGRCLLGFQSIAQVSGTYGHAEAQTIVENCGNTLILRCSASERGGTSNFASQLIGQHEVVRTTESRSRRALQLRPTITRSQQFNIEPAVLSAEIEQLPDLKGYLKFASSPQWQRVTLSPPLRTADSERAASDFRTEARRMWEEFRGGERASDRVSQNESARRGDGAGSTGHGQGKPPAGHEL